MVSDILVHPVCILYIYTMRSIIYLDYRIEAWCTTMHFKNSHTLKKKSNSKWYYLFQNLTHFIFF